AIYSIPLYVRFGDEIYKDGIDINTEELYKKVSEKNVLPQTAAPSPGDFYQSFKPLIDEGKDIIYIGIGSTISGTIQSARVAAIEFPENRVYIIDSKNLSSGIALLVL